MYSPFITDCYRMSFQFLLLRLLLHSSNTMARTLFIPYCIHFFHSLEHVSLVSNICKTALLRKYDVCNNNEYRIQYNVLKMKNAIYWSNYHRTCINHILYSSRSCAFCMRFTKRIFFFLQNIFSLSWIYYR